jgi:Ca2+-dependent lipid-binding protein
VCGTGQTCAGGTCTLNGNTLYDFVAVGAKVPVANQSGGSWDAFSGLPDPVLTATSGAKSGSTASKSDTLTPVWNTVALSGLTATALKASLKVELNDADIAFNDLMGGCSIALTATDFDGALHTAACAKSATGVAFTVDYRLKAK